MSAAPKQIPVLEPNPQKVLRTAAQVGYDHVNWLDIDRWIDNNIGKLRERYAEMEEILGPDEFADFHGFCAVQHDLCEQQAAWVLALNKSYRGR